MSKTSRVVDQTLWHPRTYGVKELECESSYIERTYYKRGTRIAIGSQERSLFTVINNPLVFHLVGNLKAHVSQIIITSSMDISS